MDKEDILKLPPILLLSYTSNTSFTLSVFVTFAFCSVIPTIFHFKFQILIESVLDPSSFIPCFSIFFGSLFCFTVWVDWIFVLSTFLQTGLMSTTVLTEILYMLWFEIVIISVSLKMEFFLLSLILFTILWRILLKEIE